MSVVYTEWKERPPPPYLLIFDHTIVKVSLAMWMLHIALCYTVVNLFHLTFIIIFSGLLDLTICSQQLLDGRSSVVHPGIIRPGWIVKRDRAGATARARNFDELWLIDHLVHNLYRHPLYVAVFRHFFFSCVKLNSRDKVAWHIFFLLVFSRKRAMIACDDYLNTEQICWSHAFVFRSVGD